MHFPQELSMNFRIICTVNNLQQKLSDTLWSWEVASSSLKQRGHNCSLIKTFKTKVVNPSVVNQLNVANLYNLLIYT